jgi:hypothetical protein
MTSIERRSRSTSGTGSGPTVGSVKRFLADAPDGVQLVIEKIPRDRPFDPEGWRLSYTEEIKTEE